MVTRVLPMLLLLFVVLPLAQITRARAIDVDPTDFLPSGSGVLRTVQGDVDGDGRDDLVTLYALPSQGTSPPHASLLVLLLADDGPRPIHLFGVPPNSLRGEPILDPDGSTDLALRDLTGDGHNEILLTVVNRFQNAAPRELVWVFGHGEAPAAPARERGPLPPPWTGTGFRLEAYVEGTRVDVNGPSDPGGSAIVRQDSEQTFTGPSPSDLVSETYRWRSDGFRLTERSLTLPPDADIGGSPETAVLGFYQAVGSGDHAAAAALLDDAIRGNAAPGPFADPGAALSSVRIDEVRLLDNGGSQQARVASEQTVYVRGSAMSSSGNSQTGERQSFAGTWRVRPDGDRWHLEEAGLHQTVDLAALADALPPGTNIVQTADGDLRNQGTDDRAVLASAPGRFALAEPYVLFSEGGALQPAVPLASFVKDAMPGGPAGQLQIADVNGDGSPEIAFSGIVGAHAELLWILHWDGSTLAPLFAATSNTPAISLTDLDGDGIAEITLLQSGYCGSYAASPVLGFAFRWDEGAYRSATHRYPAVNAGLDQHAANVLATFPTGQEWNGPRSCVQHMLATASAFRGDAALTRDRYRAYAALRSQTDPGSPLFSRPVYLGEPYVEADLRAALATAESGESPGWGAPERAALHDLLGDALDERGKLLEQQAKSAADHGRPDDAASVSHQADAARTTSRQEYTAALALDPTDAEAQRALAQ
jgi:hypothetical protein